MLQPWCGGEGDDNSGESREGAGVNTARPELTGLGGYKDLGTALRPRAVSEQF